MGGEWGRESERDRKNNVMWLTKLIAFWVLSSWFHTLITNNSELSFHSLFAIIVDINFVFVCVFFMRFQSLSPKKLLGKISKWKKFLIILFVFIARVKLYFEGFLQTHNSWIATQKKNVKRNWCTMAYHHPWRCTLKM